MAEGMTTVADTLIAEKLDEVKELVQTMHMKLFGDMDSEHPNGRLPAVERRQEEQDKRISTIERWKERRSAYMGMVGTIFGGLIALATAVAHLISAVKH